MKLPRNKTYQGFFLSDVHYLLKEKIRKHSHKELLQMLDYVNERGIRFQNIYLVGDIIEAWYFSPVPHLIKSKERFDKLFDRIDRLIAPGGNKHYIIGNHDTTSFSMKLSPEIESYLTERNWNVCEKVETDKMIVIHGHQGQYSRFSWMYHILGVRICFILANIIPGLFQVAEKFYDKYLNHENPDSIEAKLKYYRRLSRTVNQGQRLLIAGHTHNFLRLSAVNILNTGDWLDSKTFIIQTKKKFMGIRMKTRKKYKKEFTLKLKT